jgi:hypothetical protein
MKLRYFYPLVGFVLPTLAIGYGLVIPRSCIRGSITSPLGLPLPCSVRASRTGSVCKPSCVISARHNDHGVACLCVRQDG